MKNYYNIMHTKNKLMETKKENIDKMEGCIKCSINLMEMNKFDNDEECLQYLIEHNLIIERKYM